MSSFELYDDVNSLLLPAIHRHRLEKKYKKLMGSAFHLSLIIFGMYFNNKLKITYEMPYIKSRTSLPTIVKIIKLPPCQKKIHLLAAVL